MSTSHLLQSPNQTGVEDDQQQERSDGSEHEVADGPVDDEVRCAESQLGGVDLDLVATVACFLVLDRLLEETRNVVEDGGNDDDRDRGTCPRQRTNLAPQRHTYRNVAIYGHQHDHPDRHRLRDRRQRPNVRLEERVRRAERAPGAAASPLRPRVKLVDRFDGLDEYAGDQVDDVDDGERLEQPVCGAVLVTVAAQNHKRESVSDEADEAEQADDTDVYDDSEHEVTGAGRSR